MTEYPSRSILIKVIKELLTKRMKASELRASLRAGYGEEHATAIIVRLTELGIWGSANVKMHDLLNLKTACATLEQFGEQPGEWKTRFEDVRDLEKVLESNLPLLRDLTAKGRALNLEAMLRDGTDHPYDAAPILRAWLTEECETESEKSGVIINRHGMVNKKVLENALKSEYNLTLTEEATEALLEVAAGEYADLKELAPCVMRRMDPAPPPELEDWIILTLGLSDFHHDIVQAAHKENVACSKKTVEEARWVMEKSACNTFFKRVAGAVEKVRVSSLNLKLLVDDYTEKLKKMDEEEKEEKLTVVAHG